MSIFLISLLEGFIFSNFWDDFVSVLAGIVQLICCSGRILLKLSFNYFDCISGIVLLCFFNSSSPSMILTTWLLGIVFFTDSGNFYCFAVKTCVRDVISAIRLTAWHTSLKNDGTHWWIFRLYEMLKINSMHLCSAKRICPNFWVLV